MEESAKWTLDRIVSSAWNYWLSLGADCLAVLLFFVFTLLSYDGRSFVALASVASGYVFWTALEYVLHRYILHGPPSAARRGHSRHHRDDAALLATPAFFIPLVALALWLGLRLVFADAVAAAFLLGATTGYLCFGLLHHAFHHWRTDLPLLRRLREAHEIHHRYPLVNFGTTTTVWDHLFGTYQATARSRAAG